MLPALPCPWPSRLSSFLLVPFPLPSSLERYAKMGQHADSRRMEMDDEAAERIVEFYTTLRSKGHQER